MRSRSTSRGGLVVLLVCAIVVVGSLTIGGPQVLAEGPYRGWPIRGGASQIAASSFGVIAVGIGVGEVRVFRPDGTLIRRVDSRADISPGLVNQRGYGTPAGLIAGPRRRVRSWSSGDAATWVGDGQFDSDVGVGVGLGSEALEAAEPLGVTSPAEGALAHSSAGDLENSERIDAVTPTLVQESQVPQPSSARVSSSRLAAGDFATRGSSAWGQRLGTSDDLRAATKPMARVVAGGRYGWLAREDGLWRIDLTDGSTTRSALGVKDIQAVAASPDGGQIVVAGEGAIFLSDADADADADGNGKSFQQVAGFTGAFGGVAVNANGQILYADVGGSHFVDGTQKSGETGLRLARPAGLPANFRNVVTCGENFLMVAENRPVLVTIDAKAELETGPGPRAKLRAEFDAPVLPEGAGQVLCDEDGDAFAVGNGVWKLKRRMRATPSQDESSDSEASATIKAADKSAPFWASAWAPARSPTDGFIRSAATWGDTIWFVTDWGIWAMARTESRAATRRTRDARCAMGVEVDAEVDPAFSSPVMAIRAALPAMHASPFPQRWWRTALPKVSISARTDRLRDRTDIVFEVMATFALEGSSATTAPDEAIRAYGRQRWETALREIELRRRPTLTAQTAFAADADADDAPPARDCISTKERHAVAAVWGDVQ